LRWRWRAVAHALDESFDEVFAASSAPAAPAPGLASPAPGLALATPANDVAPLGPGVAAPAPDGTPAPAPALTLEQATAAIEEAIRSAGPGLTVIQAACGVGKTRAAERVALERAKKPYASPHALGERAPLGSKTAFAFDKNALSLESYGRLRAHGASVQRRFGPASKTDAEGRPLCRLVDVARPLVAGGQSLQRELCEGRGIARCPHYDGCEARLRYEGDGGAPIVLGTHALLGELDEAAGVTGLLVIDEPPGLLETVAIDAGALAQALDLLAAYFEPRYGAILRPLVAALLALLEQAPHGEPPAQWADEALLAVAPHVPAHRLDAACRAADLERTPLGAYLAPAEVDPFANDLDDTGTGVDAPAGHAESDLGPGVRARRDAYDLARALAVAVEPSRPSRAPPLLYLAITQALHRPALADRLGAASHVLGTLQRFFDGKTPGLARVRWHQGKPRLLVTMPRGDLLDAVTREGAVVVLDANADVHLPLYEKILGGPPCYVRLPAPPDGAPVARKHEPKRATRTHWMAGKRLAEEESMRAIT
ncbi:MAG TPA: hypothetical protein VFS00_08955, partial [Polyangiaceae bacterium]|nr:hypothetical protein [Polyangiaceae bacterium]